MGLTYLLNKLFSFNFLFILADILYFKGLSGWDLDSNDNHKGRSMNLFSRILSNCRKMTDRPDPFTSRSDK
ncbi:MAG: hypothetical protein EA360_10510 [Balneolaceae bacterium]|nr:MAG: hypothetical protein EA360_10510 [Balneolaceae bacterium]